MKVMNTPQIHFFIYIHLMPHNANKYFELYVKQVYHTLLGFLFLNKKIMFAIDQCALTYS